MPRVSVISENTGSEAGGPQLKKAAARQHGIITALARWLQSSKMGAAVRVGVKCVIGAALLVWLHSSGKLHYEWFPGLWNHWPLLLVIFGLVIAQMVLMAWRWTMLLDAQQVRLGLGTTIRLTFIGTLFSAVLPGAIGGDVVKAYYTYNATPARKATVLLTILVDRVVGLMGLLFVAAAVSVWHLSALHPNLNTRRLCLSVLILGIVSAVLVFLSLRWGPATLRVLVKRRGDYECLGKLLPLANVVDEYRHRPKALIMAQSVSAIIQIMACVALYLSALAIGVKTLSFSAVLVVAPLVLLTLAIPLTPIGVGVGQAAFVALLENTRLGLGAEGANCLSVYQIIMLFAYLSGLYFYVSGMPSASQTPPSADCGLSRTVGA